MTTSESRQLRGIVNAVTIDAFDRCGTQSDMSISAETLNLARLLCAELDPPEISSLHLPDPATLDEYRDEFGILYLSDGSCAPFYVSLPGTLDALHKRFPDPRKPGLSLQSCLDGLADTSLPERALAVGAWNALSQHLIRRADFACPARGSSGGFTPKQGEQIGMVGYFCPIIDRLVENGVEVMVIEQQPGRVPRRPGVQLSEDLASLAACRLVYCTASTLINDSLEQVLDHCRNAEAVDLIGPTGSGLPDILFNHGIRGVGGVRFENASALRDQLRQRESWGSVGHKYELTATNYPGFEVLLASATGYDGASVTINLNQGGRSPSG